MGNLRRSASLGSGARAKWRGALGESWVQLTYPVLALGLLGCAATLWLLMALLGDHDHAMQEREYLQRMGSAHVPHAGFHDAPLLERIKAVDAALHVAEAERTELASIRTSLMKEISLDGDEGEDEEAAAKVATWSYADRAVHPDKPCASFTGDSPQCSRQPVALTLPLPKIFIYDLPAKFNREMVKKYKRCATDQYGTEVFFHEALLTSELRVRKPEQADMFFVPVYGECFLWQHEMLRHESRDMAYTATNSFFLEALSMITHNYPWWNRTQGRDHIFVFPGARGPTIFSDWQTHISKSVYLTPEGDRKAYYYNTWKDVVIPGLEADEQFWGEASRQQLLDEPPERKFLAYFRGTIFHREGNAYSRGLRPRLHALFANETDIIYGTKKKDCDRKCYRQEMTESKFCLNPLGWSPWTLRFYQAVMTRCIPVLIADDIEFPFESEIDYSQFALKIAEKDVDNIVALMRSMPDDELERRRQYMDRLWKSFTYQRPPVEEDAFFATMRELARKHRAFKTSSLHSWS